MMVYRNRIHNFSVLFYKILSDIFCVICPKTITVGNIVIPVWNNIRCGYCCIVEIHKYVSYSIQRLNNLI